MGWYPSATAGLGQWFTRTIMPPTSPTNVDALDIQDAPPGFGRTGGASLIKVSDSSGSPIWSVGPFGGPAVYGDYSKAGAGVFGPFVAMDGPNQAFVFDVGGVNHPALRLFAGSGAPAGGLVGSNVGDWYLRTDTPGTGGQRLYIKTAAAVWTATTL